jgi:iron-sulfur cluster repair protein YtfE (RIC family)
MPQNANAVVMLIEDHRRVQQLFQAFHAATDPSEQQRIAEQVMQELEVHATIEEEIFYPALREQGDAQDKELVAEAYDEHAIAKHLIEQLRGMTTADPQFVTLFQQLQQDVEHHVQEEETEMLPKAEEELKSRLDALGEEMLARKQLLVQEMQSSR